MKGRVLGIDMGRKRIGLAISDPLGLIAQGLDTIENTTEDEVIRQIGRRVKEHEVARIVLGLPLNMDGSRGPQAAAVIDLSLRLQSAIGVPVETWDERRTSVEADRILREGGVRGERRKRLQDRLAAQIILQAFLDRSDGPE